MAATIEKVFDVKVGVTADNTALIALDGKDEAKVLLECPKAMAQKLTMQLINAGFGPNKVGRA